jgi:hypothetical protein
MKKLSFVVLLAAASCGGSNHAAPPPAAPDAAAPPPAPAPAPTAPSEPVVGPPQVAWKDMTKQQRGKYMNAVVMPKMKEIFTAFDAKEFEKVTCATCHGAGAKDGSFHMPNPDILVLPGTPAEFEALAKQKPEWMKFMATKVKPEMAKLLGLPEFDPKNPQPGTFGCSSCHTSNKK